MRRAYVAHRGQSLAVWLDTRPPPAPALASNGRWPVWHPPDAWHANAIGTADSILRDLQTTKALPQELYVIPIEQEWAERGVRMATERKRRKIVDRETINIFAADWMAARKGRT